MTKKTTSGRRPPSGWRVAVLGGGAWGTALALAMLRAGHFVRLYARDISGKARAGKCRDRV
ncbi:MAG: glycerol-3-phosphate dehydrogenase, partial [Mesorhizobium sp.]